VVHGIGFCYDQDMNLPFRLAFIGAAFLLTTAAAGLAADLCVVSPRLTASAGGDAHGLVALANPTILARGPLREVLIERQGRVVWQQLAAPGEALEGPIVWPLAAIRPAETLRVRLRPLGAAATDFASFRLTGAPRQQMAAAAALLGALGSDPQAWFEAIEQQLDHGDVAFAWLLLYAAEAPSSPSLDALRRQIYLRGCGAS